jgi:hypothetical protein
MWFVSGLIAIFLLHQEFRLLNALLDNRGYEWECPTVKHLIIYILAGIVFGFVALLVAIAVGVVAIILWAIDYFVRTSERDPDENSFLNQPLCSFFKPRRKTHNGRYKHDDPYLF